MPASLDKPAWKEETNPYYKYIKDEKTANMLLSEFGLYSDSSHIINGHTPVHAAEGESPVKANGKVIVIDGGFCKAYQGKTGTAGYTLIFNSHGFRIKAHRPFFTMEKALTDNEDIQSDSDMVEILKSRKYVKDTDNGKNISVRICDLELLLRCYRNGSIIQM